MSFPEEQLPREFGKYHLIEKVATGGMAELFRAKLYGAGGFEKDLAVKKILPQLGQDQDFIQMFMDEAMITVTLNHGNIAQVLDFGEINGEYFLVMEYVDGVDLQNLLKRITEEDVPIPTELAAYIVQEICKGLDYAHHKLGTDGEPLNIVHRDVSPQNVIISFEGQVKLVDFGIARAASRITSTQAGVVKGKMDYMSPEQLLGKGVDAKSDVWAAGVILYELLTLHKPFSGGTPQETMAAITRGSYKPPQKLNRQVSRKLAAVLKKALEGNTKKRYQTAGKMAQSLASYLHSTGQPPSPLTLAQLLRQRLPYEKPRTLNPTPVEIKHRQEHSRSSITPRPSTPHAPETQPPAADQNQPPAEPEQKESSFAPALQHEAPSPKRRSTAPEFSKIEAGASQEGTDDRASDLDHKPSAVMTQGDEAISFSDLGLPGQYQDESTPEPKPAPAQEDEALDFDDATIVQRTIVDEAEEPMAELAAAAAIILSDAPALDLPSDKENDHEQATSSQSGDDSLASYDDDLHNAATTLRNADEVLEIRGDIGKTNTAQGESAASQKPLGNMEIDEEQWLEQPSEQQGADFDDEAPPQAKKTSAALRPILLITFIVVVLGILVVYVWNPFEGGQKPDDVNTAVAMSPQVPKRADKTDLPNNDHAEEKNTEVKEPPDTVKLATTQPDLQPLVQPDKHEGTKKDAEIAKHSPEPDINSKVDSAKRSKKRSKKKHAKKHRTKQHRKPAPRVAKAKGIGTLKINSEPFSVVYWNGKRMGPTPQMDIRLPAGSHTLELRNEALGLSRRVRVRIEPNKVQTVFVELRR